LCLLCTYLFVVQFSMTVLFAAFAFARRLDYYITLSSLCQYFFQNFFKFFSKHPLGRQLHYFITLYLSCQVVFKNFCRFVYFYTQICKKIIFLYHFNHIYPKNIEFYQYSSLRAAPITVPNCAFLGIMKLTLNTLPKFKNVSVIGFIAVRLPVRIISFIL